MNDKEARQTFCQRHAVRHPHGRLRAAAPADCPTKHIFY